MRLRLILFSAAMLLSLSAFAEEPYAVVKVPVGNLREEPRHGAELMSQGIMGTPLQVKSRQGEWLAVVMPDGYEGFMIDNSVALMDKEQFDRWRTSRRAVVDVMSTEMLSDASCSGSVVSPLQLADIVTVTDTLEGGEVLAVELPDGRRGFISSAAVKALEPFGSNRSDDRADIVTERGLRLVGQEYLWGGTSVKANDCSGFTRVLFQSAGVYLPRDAWQQALAGKEVSADELQKGDLIFFSNAKGRVIHVGIYIGDGLMLHCSGRVRIDCLFPDKAGATDAPLYTRRPSKFRRVLSDQPLESEIEANKLYFKEQK